MASLAFRGELLLTLEEALEFNKNLEKACLELYGFDIGHVPWRVCAIDQSIRTHTPSSLSLATALRELDATVDPQTIINQPLNRRSSYKLDASPVRSPLPPSPPPVEVKPEPKPVKKVEEKVEYDPESDFYKLLHPPMEKLSPLQEWTQAIHKIIVELCYMPEVKPFLSYFNPKKEADETSENRDEPEKRNGKTDKTDDFGFDVLSDELNDILMDIDDMDPLNRKGGTEEGENKKETNIKSEQNVDGHSSVEEVDPLNGVTGLTSTITTSDPEVNDQNTDQINKTMNGTASNKESDSNYRTEIRNDTNNTHSNDGINEAHTPRGQSENEDVNVADDTKVSSEDNGKKGEDEVKSGEEPIQKGLESDGVDGEKTNESETQVKSDEQGVQQGEKAEDGKEEATESKLEGAETTKAAGARGFEYILENLLENKFENASYVFSLLYTFLVQQFKVAIPGSREWMCAQDVSNKLEELRSEKRLSDAEKLHNFQETPKPEAPPPQTTGDLPAHREPKRPRTSMEDFEHELSLINNVNEYSPTISLPEVQSITDEERMEFYENAMLLQQDFQMELFTVFEHAAVWKIVGNGEIELDDQNTDPKIYRGMIKWVKEKRSLTPAESKETTPQPPQVSSEIVV
ncbi:conserved hypothetical protein [Theileria orientalis strain Shintoku]|uniref:Uncharacterized protein n=1 Tax=Theileria orientalis strain Shintoku TaxID=869250 RepID=J4DNR8_THEOR|nr:conserved hypothetical protein [Theileria orientalis strain Shintoku]BAM39434.1 conserved hypothetical protein [Theileria orientalis strain Shintoku]|eukprot:XP_009689735.1 conserved hypothetical protein [Theileria orientalis strain Shintoku]